MHDIDVDEIPVVVSRFEDFEGIANPQLSSRSGYFSTHGDAVAHKIASKLNEIDACILSLDVFDTLLIRDNISEAHRYLQWAERLEEEFKGKRRKGPALDTRSLLTARAAGFRLAYRTAEKSGAYGEGRISDVYAYMSHALRLNQPEVKKLAEIEIAYENDRLSLNPAIEKAMRQAREDGRIVLLLSDMYLEAAFIEDLVMRKCGGEKLYDQVYSSADVLHSKRSGTIFELIETTYDVPSKRILHIGDSATSDVANAMQAGWHAMHMPVLRAELVERHKDFEATLDRLKQLGVDTAGWAQV